MEATPSVLCALGDERQRAFICDQLAADGYPVEPAASRSELQIRARRQPPGVLLLGSVERRHDELALLRAIRADDAVRADIDPAVAVIVLGAEAGELWLPRAFAAGCDDYLACPPTYPELRARIDALARRAGLRAEGPKRHGGLRIDPRRRLATYAGRPLALSALEFALLNQLARRPDPLLHQARAAARRLALPGARQNQDRGRAPCRLRKRLEAAGARGYIANVRGVGYRLAQLAAAGPDDQGRASGDGTGTLVELGVQRRAA
jgi:two-component system response regulator QseB